MAETEEERKARLAREAQAASIAASLAPYLAAAMAGGSKVGKGAQVWRVGGSYVDPKTGKRVTATGGPTTAVYDLTQKQVAEIVFSEAKTLAQQNKIRADLVKAGYLSAKDLQTRYPWNNATDGAAFLKLLENANMDGSTWQDRLDVDIAAAEAAKGRAGGPTRQVTKSVDVSSPSTARAFVQNAFRSTLGRDATDDELSTMVASLNKAERKAPSVTTTTYSKSGTTQYSTTMGTGGLDRQQVLEEQIMESPKLQGEAVNKRINEYADVVARLAGF